LGCIFTQTKTDAEGYLIRDPDSTTYTGAIESSEQFGKRPQSGSLEAGLEPRPKEGGPGRWIGVDLESGSAAFPRRHTDGRPVSGARTSGS
jgi:hypothetical protein